MAKYRPMRIFYVGVFENKVIFAGDSYPKICERMSEERTDGLYRQMAKNYKDAVMAIAESHQFIVNQEVQDTFKLLRGYY